mgnify:CR=1 FL=1
MECFLFLQIEKVTPRMSRVASISVNTENVILYLKNLTSWCQPRLHQLFFSHHPHLDLAARSVNTPKIYTCHVKWWLLCSCCDMAMWARVCNHNPYLRAITATKFDPYIWAPKWDSIAFWGIVSRRRTMHGAGATQVRCLWKHSGQVGLVHHKTCLTP